MQFTRKFSRGPAVQERPLLELHSIYLWEYNQKLWFKEGCSWSIVVTQWRLVLRLHANTLTPDIYWREWPTMDPFGTIPQEPWHPEKGAKPDYIIQHNWKEICLHASYKTTRTCKNFNNRGTKMILLSNELWLIANNSKSFVNRSKSIIRNNLGLPKYSEIYLI